MIVSISISHAVGSEGRIRVTNRRTGLVVPPASPDVPVRTKSMASIGDSCEDQKRATNLSDPYQYRRSVLHGTRLHRSSLQSQWKKGSHISRGRSYLCDIQLLIAMVQLALKINASRRENDKTPSEKDDKLTPIYLHVKGKQAMLSSTQDIILERSWERSQ